MFVCGVVKAARLLEWLVHIVKAISVRSESKPSEVATRKKIRKTFSSFDFKELECPCPFPSLLHFIEKQFSIWRDAQRFHRRGGPGTSCSGVNQQVILALCAFPHVNAWLFLIGQTFAEEKAVCDSLRRVIGFNGKEFADALTNLIAGRDPV